MSKSDGGEIPSGFSSRDSVFTNGAEPVGHSLSLQAQDGFVGKGSAKRLPGEPIQLASAASPEDQQGSWGGAWDTKPPQAEIVDRERRRLLEQQTHHGGADNICVDIQRDGNVDNAGLHRIAGYLQHKQSEFGANRLTLQSNVAEINAKFDQLAAPGQPHYQLSATMFGNRTHIELTDLSVRPRTPENLDPRAYQTQESRNRIAQERLADYRRRAVKGVLDFDTLAPRPLEGDRPADAVLDRIARFGQFSNPNSGVGRRFEFEEAQRRFPNQESAPDVVHHMNEKLAAAGSEFRLVIEPPSNSRQAHIYQSMQISIVNRDGRRYDTLQIPPTR